jgi:hypothetical protein
MSNATELMRRAAERYEYDESSPSCLVWKVDSGKGKKGKPAGSLASRKKYYSVQAIPGKSVRAHHVVWFLFHGSAPDAILDHINGNGLDNRIENLRPANSTENNWNRKIQTANISGIKNVYYREKYGTYRVSIWKHNKQINIGTFKTVEEAVLAAQKAREEHHGNYARQS